MKKNTNNFKYLLILPVLMFYLSSTFTATKSYASLKAFNDEMISVCDKVLPTVVSISVVQKKSSQKFGNQFFFGFPFGPQMPRNYQAKSSGSGVIIDKKGYIVTNNHVVKNAEKITVTLNNRKEYKCKVIGTDPATDLALIKIIGKVPRNLKVAAYANSNKIKVGQVAIAVGNSLGFPDTVTMGIVSAVGRHGLGLADYENLIQTDAAINPGNSGGALVDINGKLIGINVAIVSKSGGYQGIGFAIASNMVKNVVRQLINRGKVTRGWLGVYIQELTPDLADKMNIKGKSGAIISDIIDGSPASKSGLRTGDLIVSIDGKKVSKIDQLRKIIAAKTPGAKINIKILRKGKRKDYSIKIGLLPDKAEIAKKSDQKSKFGLAVRDIDEKLAYKFNINDKRGVVVVNVERGSIADRSNLQVGDVIKEIDNTPIRSSKEFYRLLRQKRKSSKLLFLIKRSGFQRFVVVYLDKKK